MERGVIISAIGHVGVVLITLASWPMMVRDRDVEPVTIVPVSVVAIAATSNVRALSPTPDAPVTPAATEEPPRPQEVEPAPSPTPQPRPRPRQRNELDLSALNSELLPDRTRTATAERVERAERDPRTQRGAGLSTAETAALNDRIQALIRAHIARGRCWREPVDARDPGRLAVVLRLTLDRNGVLRGNPAFVSPRTTVLGADPELRAAMEGALRAVRACSPFTPLVEDAAVSRHYELWRDLEYEFVPNG